jgi:predicted transcriptional regulator
LAHLARAQARSKAELIREALEAYLERHNEERPLPDWVGAGHSGDGRLAERDEELLAELLERDFEKLLVERKAGS